MVSVVSRDSHRCPGSDLAGHSVGEGCSHCRADRWGDHLSGAHNPNDHFPYYHCVLINPPPCGMIVGFIESPTKDRNLARLPNLMEIDVAGEPG